MTDTAATLSDSGIWIPDRDPEKGHPFVQVILDNYPGAVVNIVGPSEADVAYWAGVFEDARQRQEAGEFPDPIPFTEPAYGTRGYISPAALGHIVMVCQGWMPQIHIDAMRKAGEGERERRAPQLVAVRGTPDAFRQ